MCVCEDAEEKHYSAIEVTRCLADAAHSTKILDFRVSTSGPCFRLQRSSQAEVIDKQFKHRIPNPNTIPTPSNPKPRPIKITLNPKP